MLSREELLLLMRSMERLYSCRVCIIDGNGNFLFSSNFPEMDTTHLSPLCKTAKKHSPGVCRDCDDLAVGQHADAVRSAFWKVCPFGGMDLVGTVLPPGGKRFQIFAGSFRPRPELTPTALVFPRKHSIPQETELRELTDSEFESFPVLMDMLTREMAAFFETGSLEKKETPDPKSIVENCVNGLFRNDVSLSYIAGKLGWSDSYAAVRIRQMFGKSFVTLLNERRIENVKWLLENQFYQPVASIAKVSGFRNTPYFHRVFLRSVGMTPIEYRNSKKSQKRGDFKTIRRKDLNMIFEKTQTVD